MELQNGTENRIRELDKNVWGYCIMSEIDTFISQVNQLRFSPDTFDTELKRIQTDFDEYVKSLNFFDKIKYRNLIKKFKNAVKYTKNQIEIDKLEKYIRDYRTESQKLINNNNCSEDENEKQIEEIFKKGEPVINHFNLLKTLDIEDKNIEQINKLIVSFDFIKEQTTYKYLEQLKICEKIKIIKDGNYKVVEELIKNDLLYYKYNSKTKTVTLLGQYKGTKVHTFYDYDEKPLRVFVFENNDTTVEIDAYKLKNQEIFIKEPVNLKDIVLTIPPSGGKPRRTRRRKNKKRRSSKQQKSKK